MMPEGGVLRPMTVADVPKVIDVQEPSAILGLGQVFPQDEYPFPRDAIAGRWRVEIASQTIDCLVIEQDDAIAGFAATRRDELLHFGLAVELWGTGLAQVAHDEVLDRMRARHLGRAWLRVFTENGRARRFYEKLGWQPTGERTHSSYAPFAELLRYERGLS